MSALFSSQADLLDNGAMTNYPGEPVNPADQPSPTPAGADEPTQEVGYWQSQEQGSEPTAAYEQSAPVWNPTSQQPYGSVPPVVPPPAPMAASGGQPPMPPPASPYTQQPYGQVPPAVTPGYSPVQVPVLPQANTALIIGVIALAGAFVCFLPIFASPFAWISGTKAINAVKASNGQYRGETEARIGQVLGIIGTVLLGLAIIGLVLFFVLIAGIAGQSAYSGVVST